MIGQLISHYRVVDRLGAGGMGVVYKAVDLKLERTVALKFISSEIAVAGKDRAQLLQEARSASALDHPNIGVIHGIEETDDGHLFIVMAYYEGETLAHRLLRRGSLPVREALDIAVQIAAGLSAAHTHHVVHRDIKPSNILITRGTALEGESGRSETASGERVKGETAKIVDFGLARVVASASATQTFTSSGTLAYMAPEQILAEPIGASCDIWALGVVIAEMITGEHPFKRESGTAMTFAILNSPPAGIEKVHAALRPLLYRALSKDPVYRDPTGGKMLASLQIARDGLGDEDGWSAHEDKTQVSSQSRPSRELKQFMERASAPRWAPAVATKPRRLLLALLLLVALATAAAFVPSVRQRVAGLWGGESYHIAVLPFDNIGDNPANAPVAEGLMDSFTGELSNLDASQKSLWVVPASLVRSRKVTDPSAALRDLGADLVVKGSIQRNGQQIRLTVNLIDAKRMRQIGSASFEDQAGDLAALQDEAVAQLARLMRINVSAGMLRATGGNVAPAAYESYLKALGYLQRYDKPGNVDLAIASLKTATQTDPGFALGYAALGNAYRLKNNIDPNAQWTEEASAYLKKATELDASLPAAYVALGRLHSATGNNDLALQEFARALKINPRDPDALSGLAHAYVNTGRIADAEAAFKKAAALRPDYWDSYNSLGQFYEEQNRNQEAVAAFRKVVELTPDNAAGYSNLATAYMGIGDAKSNAEAEAALKKSIALAPSYAAYGNLGALYNDEKRWAESVHATRQALAINDQNYVVWQNLMGAYLALHDKKAAAEARAKATALLEKYVVLHPQDAGAQSALADFYAADHLREKALMHMETALALNPKDPSVLADIAEAYEDLGDRKQALEYARLSLQNGNKMDDLQSRTALASLLADPSFRSNGK
ncbi:MAG: protein kinase [Acidobacteriaceae bacterium]